MEKTFWKNKRVFILAAIGSAAGLGNLWKFPYMVYDYGGGAFIIAYLVILFIMGIGLLIGEIAIGQYTQKGAPEAFGTINVYLKWLGWAGILTAGVILTYYVVVIGWGIDYLVYSINSLINSQPLPWGVNSSDFFFKNVLYLTDSIEKTGGISIPVLWGTIIGWILIYLFTFKSVKSVGKVVLITATFPFLILAILAIRGVTLPGAEIGLSYLTSIDLNKLYSLKTWIAAAGQIFFTLSLAMGIMIAYGSLKKKDSEIVQSTIIVAIGNTIISFLSAIAVFGTLGYMAFKKGVGLNEVFAGGPSLAFITFPEAIYQLPALQSVIAVLFFITIFMLAIDSAMSLIEAVSVAIRDKFEKVPVEIVTLGVVIILGLGSLIYTFGNGLYILDIVDYFITSYSMLFIGFLEAIIFIYLWKKLGRFIDERNKCLLRFVINKWYFLVSWIISICVLGYLLGSNIFKIIKDGLIYGGYPKEYLIMYGIYILIGIYAISVLLNIIDINLSKQKKSTK